VHHLGGQRDIAVTVAMHQPARYAAEPVNQVLPIDARFVDRGAPGLARVLRDEGFDLLIVDNHLPEEAIAPRLFVLWHGFGWRLDDLSTMRKELASLVGDVTRPNPRFRWQAFGKWDREYRIRHSRLARQNVVALGSAYSDLLRPEAGLRERVRVRLGPDGPQVLLGLTWHHGAALAHWGNDAELLGRLFDHVAEKGASVLVRMHDRHRFEPHYLAALERVAADHPRVQIKFRNQHPDSLVDLLRSDVLVSNYSSLLNAYYYTRRPTVHLDPHEPDAREFVYKRWKRGRLREARTDRREEIWKLDPGEIGGLRAQSFEAALAAIDRALAEPSCCEELSRRFTDRYITGVDGHTSERITEYLRAWLTTPAS
jgi:hypothetical protein